MFLSPVCCRRCVLPLVSKAWRAICDRQTSIVWRDVELLVTRRGESIYAYMIENIGIELDNAALLFWLGKRAPGLKHFRLGGVFDSIKCLKVRCASLAILVRACCITQLQHATAMSETQSQKRRCDAGDTGGQCVAAVCAQHPPGGAAADIAAVGQHRPVLGPFSVHVQELAVRHPGVSPLCRCIKRHPWFRDEVACVCIDMVHKHAAVRTHSRTRATSQTCPCAGQ